MKRTLFGALLALSFAGQALATDVYTIDPKHSEATFQVRHMVTKVRGRFKDFSGTINIDQAKPESSSVVFTIKADSIDTDVDARNGHLKSPDFFDVAKYPTITFKSTRVALKSKDVYDVTGDFTMHGVTKSITLPVTVLGFVPGKPAKAGFETSTTLNRKDFNIVWNKALDNGGMMLSDEVWVSINIEAEKQDAAAPKS
jgi:polyisoprenoid-binding protein YceI